MDSIEATVAILAVLIPTGSGIIGSKWITNSWQKRKEETKIKSKILDQMDESHHMIYSLIANFVNRMNRGYTDYTPKHDANGKALPNQSIFPTSKNDMPANKFRNEFLEFEKEYERLTYAGNRFGSSLALYFPSLLESMRAINEKSLFAFYATIQMYHSENKEYFEACFKLVKDTLDEARKMQQDLAFQIIKPKKNDPGLKIPVTPTIKQSTIGEESNSDKLTRQMSWYGIKYGAFIAVGAAFFASGISAFIAEYSLIPELFKGDPQAANAINALSGWFNLLLLLGGLLIGIGIIGGKRRTTAEKI